MITRRTFFKGIGVGTALASAPKLALALPNPTKYDIQSVTYQVAYDLHHLANRHLWTLRFKDMHAYYGAMIDVHIRLPDYREAVYFYEKMALRSFKRYLNERGYPFCPVQETLARPLDQYRERDIIGSPRRVGISQRVYGVD